MMGDYWFVACIKRHDGGLLVRGMYQTSFFPSNTLKVKESGHFGHSLYRPRGRNGKTNRRYSHHSLPYRPQ